MALGRWGKRKFETHEFPQRGWPRPPQDALDIVDMLEEVERRKADREVYEESLDAAGYIRTRQGYVLKNVEVDTGCVFCGEPGKIVTVNNGSRYQCDECTESIKARMEHRLHMARHIGG